jgi:mannosyl-oligosaccharide alpha-1,2-mannosidase
MSDFRYFPAWLNRHMVRIPHYGDTRWQEYNWEIFQALDTHRSAAVPYAGISDVNAPGGGELVNLVSR